MIRSVVLGKILKTFFEIPLSSKEKQIAIESVDFKYVPAIRNSLIYSLICLPAILFLDMGIKGNLDVSDVLVSAERFVFKTK